MLLTWRAHTRAGILAGAGRAYLISGRQRKAIQQWRRACNGSRLSGSASAKSSLSRARLLQRQAALEAKRDALKIWAEHMQQLQRYNLLVGYVIDALIGRTQQRSLKCWRGTVARQVAIRYASFIWHQWLIAQRFGTWRNHATACSMLALLSGLGWHQHMDRVRRTVLANWAALLTRHLCSKATHAISDGARLQRRWKMWLMLVERQRAAAIMTTTSTSRARRTALVNWAALLTRQLRSEATHAISDSARLQKRWNMWIMSVERQRTAAIMNTTSTKWHLSAIIAAWGDGVTLRKAAQHTCSTCDALVRSHLAAWDDSRRRFAFSVLAATSAWRTKSAAVRSLIDRRRLQAASHQWVAGACRARLRELARLQAHSVSCEAALRAIRASWTLWVACVEEAHAGACAISATAALLDRRCLLELAWITWVAGVKASHLEQQEKQWQETEQLTQQQQQQLQQQFQQEQEQLRQEQAEQRQKWWPEQERQTLERQEQERQEQERQEQPRQEQQRQDQQRQEQQRQEQERQEQQRQEQERQEQERQEQLQEQLWRLQLRWAWHMWTDATVPRKCVGKAQLGQMSVRAAWVVWVTRTTWVLLVAGSFAWPTSIRLEAAWAAWTVWMQRRNRSVGRAVAAASVARANQLACACALWRAGVSSPRIHRAIRGAETLHQLRAQKRLLSAWRDQTHALAAHRALRNAAVRFQAGWRGRSARLRAVHARLAVAYGSLQAKVEETAAEEWHSSNASTVECQLEDSPTHSGSTSGTHTLPPATPSLQPRLSVQPADGELDGQSNGCSARGDEAPTPEPSPMPIPPSGPPPGVLEVLGLREFERRIEASSKRKVAAVVLQNGYRRYAAQRLQFERQIETSFRRKLAVVMLQRACRRHTAQRLVGTAQWTPTPEARQTHPSHAHHEIPDAKPTGTPLSERAEMLLHVQAESAAGEVAAPLTTWTFGWLLDQMVQLASTDTSESCRHTVEVGSGLTAFDDV